ncbi:MAG: ribokinase [Alphaproteobacteria bacterium]|nr:ribokinase [Alphaproteobacteria bacterium]
MIESVLVKLGIPLLINVLSESLKTMDAPVARGASKALEQVDLAIKAGQITQEQLAEANRHAEEMARLEAAEYKAAVEQVNESLRAEIASEDKFVRRMRPTFGYLMALTWAAQMLGIAYIIIFDTGRAGEVMAAMGSLSAIWAVGLSVLGIYVYKRSEDKRQGEPETIFWKSARKG